MRTVPLYLHTKNLEPDKREKLKNPNPVSRGKDGGHTPGGDDGDPLSRLPAKSVCRFRCVSKPWCELISTPNFMKLHLGRAVCRDERDLLVSEHRQTIKQMECEILSIDGTMHHSSIAKCMLYTTLINWIDGNSFHSVLKIEDPFGESFGGFQMSKLLGSCNGIVCLVKKHNACSLNPCTMEYKIVKFVKEIDFDRKAAYGFGYDDIKQDFKLVQLVDMEDEGSEINVYSTNNASINKVSNVPFTVCTQRSRFYSDEKQSGFYLNGALDWVVKRKFSCSEQVIAFDLGTNEVRHVPRPDIISKDANEDDRDNYFMACLTVGVVGGRLALFKRSDDYIDIWVLKNTDTEPLWSQVILIKKSVHEWGVAAWPLYFGDDWRVRPLQFTKTGEVLIRDEKHLVLYNLNEMENKNINIEGIPDLSEMDTVVVHCPSLVSLKSGCHGRVEVEERAP